MEQPLKHVCGQCNDEWLTDDEYLNHTCPKTGFAPTDPRSMGDGYLEIQKAALQRGLHSINDSDDVQRLIQQEAIDKLN